MLLPQNQHDDDDEEYEADQATADVDSGCEQHASAVPIRVTWQTGICGGGSIVGTFDPRLIEAPAG